MSRIRTLIVDDSALVRKVVTDSLARHPEVEVVGTAVDPYAARDKILALDPDVMTLDIEMPRMDGLTFLKLIMKHRPMPVVIMSSLTTLGSSKALEALQAGAVEVVGKPSGAYSAVEASELVAKIRAAAHSRYRRQPAAGGSTTPVSQTDLTPPPARAVAPAVGAVRAKPVAGPGSRRYPARPLILLGASTGGTEALKVVLTSLRGDLPGICIVQHIPAYFSAAFADRLNQLCELEVAEARRGEVVRPGRALVAPGGQHLLLRWTGAGYTVDLNTGPPVHHQRPAVDVLFDSAVKAGAAPHVLGMVMTGMGSDGAAGLLRLREAGAQTAAQDEQSCVVFGMPREAIRMGAAQEVLPLERFAARIERYADSVALR